MKFTNWAYTLVITTNIITMNSVYAIKQEQQLLETSLQQPSIYRENLSNLLLAEIALQQNQPAIALDYYFAVLKSTQDPALAEIALECAIQYKIFAKAVDIAMLWADLATNDINPQIIAATLVIDSLPEQAKVYLTQAIKIDPHDIDQYLLFTYKKLPRANQTILYTILMQLTTEDPNNPYLYTAAAQIAAQENKLAIANNLITQALNLQPDLTHAIQLNAKLIRQQTNEELPALKYLHTAVETNKTDEELKMFYSNALLDDNKTKEALPYLQSLTQSKTYGVEAQFILGELLLEQQDYANAYSTLIKIIQDPIYSFSAKYYLGQICEQQNKIKAAIKWYSEVRDGQFHVAATLRAALLHTIEGQHKQALQLVQAANPATFAEQKQLLLVELDLLITIKDTEHAMKLINNALELLPEDVDFLYARSLIAGLLEIPKQTEQDLYAILAIEPDHADALNALGYTLSNQPTRSKEAIKYLEQALALSPDNPTFMDSMGWALFRIGKIQDSVILLKDAYNLSKDNEIAAHLGEVLWTTGQKAQAKKIWLDALQNNPNHDILLETLTRLNVKLNLPKK